ncbi:hypothetical protein JHK87_025767 [Glycine soja]|nr:hypothetical protein JHK87_025767 [Glycine soja]
MNTMHNRNKKEEHRNIGDGRKRERKRTRWCRRHGGVVEGARVHVFGGERVARDQIWRWRRCATSKEGGGVGARRRKREAGLLSAINDL